MRRPAIPACLCLLGCLLAVGCGGQSGTGGGATENGIALGPHLFRDLERTLPDVIDEQADSPDDGVVREFLITRSFLLLRCRHAADTEMRRKRNFLIKNMKIPITG